MLIDFFFFLICPDLAVLGLQPSKLADWSSTGAESNTNGHGSASTLPRMTSLSTANAEQGRQHTYQTTCCIHDGVTILWLKILVHFHESH